MRAPSPCGCAGLHARGAWPPAAATATATAQVDYWLDYACAHVTVGAGLEGQLLALNEYLALRSFMVGHALTLADLALWGQLQGVQRAAGCSAA